MTSIYDDDIVIFAMLSPGELEILQSVLRVFGTASGLNMNMHKSSTILIRCTQEHLQTIESHLPCQVGSFPCKYLGLPLSITNLRKADLLPLIDSIADKLPGWKAALLDRAGRLILVQAVLSAIPVYTLIVCPRHSKLGTGSH